MKQEIFTRASEGLAEAEAALAGLSAAPRRCSPGGHEIALCMFEGLAQFRMAIEDARAEGFSALADEPVEEPEPVTRRPEREWAPYEIFDPAENGVFLQFHSDRLAALRERLGELEAWAAE